jgi:hypothetical protein
VTPHPAWVEANILAQPHRLKLRAAAPSDRAKMRREILRQLRADMTTVRVSVAENLFNRHKRLFECFREALDETADTDAVKAFAP